MEGVLINGAHFIISLTEDFSKAGSEDEHTEWLLSKFQLLDVWKQYIIRFDWYDNLGNPGIFGAFYFKKSTIDTTAPVWVYVDIGTHLPGTDLAVMVNEDATVYMVPEGTALDTTAVKEAALSRVEVLAHTAAKLETHGVEPGNYVVYAIDPLGNISEASRLITLQSPVNSQQIIVAPEINITYSSSRKFLRVESSVELHQIEVFNILGEKVISRKCQGKSDEFGTHELTLGVYMIRTLAEEGTFTIEKIFLR
ncbi:MAG: hypothetical protein WD577_14645 [Bacteroidales bacterium]